MIGTPSPGAACRGKWNGVHKGLGYCIILLALANAFIGLYQGSLGCAQGSLYRAGSCISHSTFISTSQEIHRFCTPCN